MLSSIFCVKKNKMGKDTVKGLKTKKGDAFHTRRGQERSFC